MGSKESFKGAPWRTNASLSSDAVFVGVVIVASVDDADAAEEEEEEDCDEGKAMDESTATS